jgi:uncharacterized membrane protein
MTDPQAASPQSPQSLSATADAKNVNLIYILYLVALAAGVTALVGVVMAYINKDTAPEWLRSHYQFQIRTFWIGLLYAFVSAILVMAVIGIGMLGFVAVWYVIRCVKGMKRIQEGQPVPNPTTWLW